jgi:hypothetical protein
MQHCVTTIQAIIAQNRCDRRSILQLGYNLGRLSEICQVDREPYWDRWKDAVAEWDLEKLQALARNLPEPLDRSGP